MAKVKPHPGERLGSWLPWVPLQLPLAAAGVVATLVMWRVVRRRRYGWAGVALAVALVLFAGWAVFLDAAVHGWDDLKLLWPGTTGLPPGPSSPAGA
jgi:hypothetical protein